MFKSFRFLSEYMSYVMKKMKETNYGIVVINGNKVMCHNGIGMFEDSLKSLDPRKAANDYAQNILTGINSDITIHDCSKNGSHGGEGKYIIGVGHPVMGIDVAESIKKMVDHVDLKIEEEDEIIAAFSGSHYDKIKDKK